MAGKTKKCVENKIINLILSGQPFCVIQKETGVTHKVIKRVIKENNLYEKYRENNLEHKKQTSASVDNKIKVKAIKRYLEFDKNKGDIIKQLIENGSCLSEIVRYTNTSQSFLKKYIKWKSEVLCEKLKKNGKIVNYNNRKKALQKAISINRGSQRKIITEKHKQQYLSLLEDGRCLAEIKRYFSQYGLKSKKVEQIAAILGKPIRKSVKGDKNPMFGKSPSVRSGIGVKGWFIADNKKVFFRSSLELAIFIYLYESKIDFQLSKHRIEYTFNNVKKTYNPDIVINNKIYEIKPSSMLEKPQNKAKFLAAKEYCDKFNLSFDLITERTYNLKKVINEDKIDKLIKDQLLMIDNVNLEKLWRNLWKTIQHR
jgi:hypothetical protein